MGDSVGVEFSSASAESPASPSFSGSPESSAKSLGSKSTRSKSIVTAPALMSVLPTHISLAPACVTLSETCDHSPPASGKAPSVVATAAGTAACAYCTVGLTPSHDTTLSASAPKSYAAAACCCACGRSHMLTVPEGSGASRATDITHCAWKPARMPDTSEPPSAAGRPAAGSSYTLLQLEPSETPSP